MGVLRGNPFLKGSPQERRISPDRSRPASPRSGEREDCPQFAAASSRPCHPSIRPGGERTLPGDSHVTPPRPWGSPAPRRPFPHIRRAAHPLPATANGAPLRAPRDLCARPHPPISARQKAPAAPLAATPVCQAPSHPPPPVSPAPASFTPCHQGAGRNEDAAALLPAATPASCPTGAEPPKSGRARLQPEPTCLRLSSTRMRRRHPTPGHQTLGPAPACGVSTPPRPGRRGAAPNS